MERENGGLGAKGMNIPLVCVSWCVYFARNCVLSLPKGENDGVTKKKKKSDKVVRVGRSKEGVGEKKLRECEGSRRETEETNVQERERGSE